MSIEPKQLLKIASKFWILKLVIVKYSLQSFFLLYFDETILYFHSQTTALFRNKGLRWSGAHILNSLSKKIYKCEVFAVIIIFIQHMKEFKNIGHTKMDYSNLEKINI